MYGYIGIGNASIYVCNVYTMCISSKDRESAVRASTHVHDNHTIMLMK